MRKIAVVGAGASGLSTAKHLLSSIGGTSLYPIVFEQKNCVGGTWIYEHAEENEQVFSSIYKNLRTNLPKELMMLEDDFCYDSSLPSFIHHTDVRAYLERYAKHHNLLSSIRFNTRVLDIRPTRASSTTNDSPLFSTGWTVGYRDLRTKDEKEEKFDAVVVCNGHYTVPFYPCITGLENYRGKVVHSHYYRSPEKLTGTNALILGAGPSGIDIATELCSTFRNVFISYRHERFQTKLPENMVELPNISHVNSQGDFVFEDGTSRAFDLFIPCTGYKYTFDFLNSKDIGLEVTHNSKVVRNLYKHMFLINNPSLCFIGIPWTIAPFPFANQQSLFAARLYSGLTHLPPKDIMLSNTIQEYTIRLKKGEPKHYFHKFDIHQFEYLREIGELAGECVVPAYAEKLYEYVMQQRKTNLLGYRMLNFKIVNKEEFVRL